MRAAPVAAVCTALFIAVVTASCSFRSVQGFSWSDALGRAQAVRQNSSFPQGVEGVFGNGRTENRYFLGKPEPIADSQALAVSIDPIVAGIPVELHVAAGRDGSKPLVSGLFLLPGDPVRYLLPLPAGQAVGSLTVRIAPDGIDGASKGDRLFAIRDVAVVPLKRGFDGASGRGMDISAGFRWRRLQTAVLYEIDAPFSGFPALGGDRSGVSGTADSPKGLAAPRAALTLVHESGAGPGTITVAARSGSVSIRSRPTEGRVVVPPELLGEGGERIEITVPDGIRLTAAYVSLLAPEAYELADLGRIAASSRTPESAFGNDPDFSLYRWDLAPAVLVFDFRDYATQDAYLKRLAFFVEKKGFAGRLAEDREIAQRHGWNAHDYRTEDLAAFFNLARQSGFQLNESELRLERLLMERGLLARGQGGLHVPGDGAIISVTRESEPALRSLFLVHESVHALFFVDREYREYATSLWASLDRDERWFWIAWFGWMHYDTASEYLMANEFQAYLLQQPVHRAEEYFKRTVPARIVGTNPELGEAFAAYFLAHGDSFVRHATELQDWLGKKYGIQAGRTSFLRR